MVVIGSVELSTARRRKLPDGEVTTMLRLLPCRLSNRAVGLSGRRRVRDADDVTTPSR